MSRALIIIGDLRETGGGLMVGLWAVQALAADFDVTVLSWRPRPLADLDRNYGTRLAEMPQIDVVTVAKPLLMLAGLLPTRGSLLKSMFLMRVARSWIAAHEPAIVVSTANEMDVGRPIIQYVHYPWIALPRPEAELRWYHSARAVALYRRMAMRIGRFDQGRQSENLSLVNSDWTGAIFRRAYGRRPVTLYPPVPIETTGRSWEDREDAVVVVGRFSPEKRTLEAIDIVRRVREAGYPLSLHLCGLPANEAYLERVKGAAHADSDWVHLHVGSTREELIGLIGRCRYALHLMIDEHFGIAVAEGIRMGCLTVVHASGGPCEIVGDPRLTYGDDDQAVARLAALAQDPDLRDEVRAHLAGRARLFSAERFALELRGHCRRWVSGPALSAAER
ncbi:glycosyltransferase [Fodinicurvata sp. EGI_FJ10296]|uniref:glycosyltransferase n=1 Tax=Fodinicurvata sp. EGI_FJ10296 TaxID=3231908 RepID=UPI00345411C4